MKWQLSKSAIQLRKQIDESYPDRDRSSDGSIGDPRHAARKSDHNPDGNGWVRAIDIDRDLYSLGKPDIMGDLLDQLRGSRQARKRLTYMIFDGKIASAKFGWRWRKYSGANKHIHHAHLSFAKLGDEDDSFWDIPMLGGKS